MFNKSSLKDIQVKCIQTLTLFHAIATNRLKLLFSLQTMSLLKKTKIIFSKQVNVRQFLL